MSCREKLRGFYAILDRDDEDLARALLDSATVLQVRIKARSPSRRPAPSRSPRPVGEKSALVALMARRLTRACGALLIVNDDVELAISVGADGVHLGQGDLPLAEARSRAPDLLIGISTHNDEQVRAAVAGGADYIGFGPVFSTSTKEQPDPVVGLDGLARAVELAGDVPVVAIGGITPERAVAVAATGAAAAAVIAAVNRADDPRSRAAVVAGAFVA